MVKRVTEQEKEQMRKLWANGCTIEQIASVYGFAGSTIHSHVKDVIRLPKRLQKNPFDLKIETIEEVKEEAGGIEVKFKGNELADKEYWVENHVEGERYEGPLDVLDLQELRDLMEVPTDYHWDKSRQEWIDFYVADSLLGAGNKLSNIQWEIDNFLQENKYAMVQVFRGAGKTVLVIGDLAYVICENREGKFFVQSETIGRSRKRVQTVRTLLMTNRQLIADYGYIPHHRAYKGVKKTWKAGEFTVKRETISIDPTLLALGWKDADTLGGHKTGGVFDDPWSLKLQKAAPKSVEDWMEWYHTTHVPTMEEAEFEYMICTRKGVEDIYYELEDNGMYAVFKRPAIVKYPSQYHYIRTDKGVLVDAVVDSDDWEISDDCNGRFSIEKFLMFQERMKSSKDTSFEQEYQLNPLPPAGLAFGWDKLKFIDGHHEFYELVEERKKEKYLKVIGGMDLAFGKSARADFTALCVVGYLHPNYYLLDIYLQRGGTLEDKAAMIRRAKQQHPMLSNVFVEADLQQSATVSEIRAKVQSVAISPVLSRQEETKLRPLKTDEFSAKDLRIMNQIEFALDGGNLYINKNAQHFDEFEREYRFFPRSAHKDVLDALGIGVSKLKTTRAIMYCFSGS